MSRQHAIAEDSRKPALKRESAEYLGVAYYRVGNYEKVLATLMCADRINKAQD